MGSKIDLHIHTTASDGSDMPQKLLKKIEDNDIRCFAITDHDTMDGAIKLDAGLPKKIKFVRGIEFSCKTSEGQCHILGYGYDPFNPSLQHAVTQVSAKRNAKTEMRIWRLKTEKGIVFPREDLEWLFAHKSAGRPHLALLLVKQGIVSSVQEAFDQYLDNTHLPVPSDISRIDARLAIQGITDAGGIACWAHPLGGEGEPKIIVEKFRTQLKLLLNEGIGAMECYYSRYNGEEIGFLVKEAGDKRLLVSGGSDYHGTNKNILLGKLREDGESVDPSQLTIMTCL